MKALSVLHLGVLATVLTACGNVSDNPPAPTASLQSAEVIDSSLEAAFCPMAESVINYDRELVITDTHVVLDPCRTSLDLCTGSTSGKWHIAHLLREAAGGSGISDADLSKFTLKWLKTFVDQPTVNGQKLDKRGGMVTQIIIPWRLASTCSADIEDMTCTLDFTKAPFQLLGIVYRPDLRGSVRTRYGAAPAGQGRFVYAFTDSSFMPLNATVIFEYALPTETNTDIVNWAKRWHELGSYDPKDSIYRAKLQDITEAFAGSNMLLASRFNSGSALLQVRTNEIAFATSTPKYQEFREFTLSCAAGDALCLATHKGMQLQNVITAQTPDYYNADPTFLAKLQAVLLTMEPQIQTETHTIPDSFLAGAARILPAAGSFQWDPALPETERRLFALSTCTGCHFRETLVGAPALQTGFHLGPDIGLRSEFLSGPIMVNLPDRTTVKYDEKLRRQCELLYLLNNHPQQTVTNPSGRPH